MYTNPILGILFIIFFYFALLRSNQYNISNNSIPPNQSQNIDQNKQKNESNYNNNITTTLEENIINLMEPIIPVDKTNNYIYSQYKPINQNIGLASIL
jgi:hypothetical protein